MRNYIKTSLCALVATVALWACREDKPAEPRKANYLDGKTFETEEIDMPNDGPIFSKMKSEISFSNPNFTWTMDQKISIPETEQAQQIRTIIKGHYTYTNGVVDIRVDSGEMERDDTNENTSKKHIMDASELREASQTMIAANEQANTLTIVMDRRSNFSFEMHLKK